MTDTAKYEQAALDFANEIREELGLKPVKRLRKGTPSCYTCPISRTIQQSSGVNKRVAVTTKLGCSASLYRHGRAVARVSRSLPGNVRRFVDLFDDGKLPHLHDPKVPV